MKKKRIVPENKAKSRFPGQKKQGVVVGIAVVALLFVSIACSAAKVTSLKVEYEESPLGIDVEQPRFSWQMESSKQGQSQRAYQVVVTDEAGKEVWNSGKVLSDLS
ncbi:MAG: hypothetical protein PHH65_09910 [Eubacteriales bacterium]|nr:hypothetical protein [Eubacteriales bacterium]